jgi:hypothetical protein|tara:strand:+ start:4153 stop:4332 length:180 start_codon:yes stop_codon:yes gene_type:complete
MYSNKGAHAMGLYIYAVICLVLGLVFINQGDVMLGALVCAAGPFWLAVAAQHRSKEDED